MQFACHSCASPCARFDLICCVCGCMFLVHSSAPLRLYRPWDYPRINYRRRTATNLSAEKRIESARVHFWVFFLVWSARWIVAIDIERLAEHRYSTRRKELTAILRELIENFAFSSEAWIVVREMRAPPFKPMMSWLIFISIACTIYMVIFGLIHQPNQRHRGQKSAQTMLI